jgi:hypothetical protein
MKIRIGLGICILLVCHTFDAVSQCAPSAPTVNGNNGTNSPTDDWSLGTSWSSGSFPGTYNAGTDTYTIPAGLVVQISASNFDLNSNLRVEGTLYVTGKLTVAASKSIAVPSGGLITCCLTDEAAECGSSDKIDFTGGGYTWSGTTPGPFNGPSSISPSGMPVVLGYFEVVPNKEQVDLTWSTIMEQGFSKFEVQRSASGVVYNTIGEVYGAGYDLTEIEKHYRFVDVTPLTGWNYYRLKAIDVDGSIEYFGLEAIKIDGDNKVSVYPNPVSGDALRVNVNFTPTEAARIRVMNQMGVEVANVAMPMFEKTLNFSHPLQPGIYTLQYAGRELVQTIKFVVKP